MTEPSIKIHTFQHKLSETLVTYQVTQLKGQTMIWIGSGDPCLGNMSAAIPTKDYPSTPVFGNDDQSGKLSSRLAKKLNKQV